MSDHVFPDKGSIQSPVSPSILGPKVVSYVENQTQTEDVIWDMFLWRESQKHEKLNSLHISASGDLNCDKIQKKSKRLHISFAFVSTREEEMIGIIHYVICFLESCRLSTFSPKGHLEQTCIYSTCTFPHWVILLRGKQLAEPVWLSG